MRDSYPINPSINHILCNVIGTINSETGTSENNAASWSSVVLGTLLEMLCFRVRNTTLDITPFTDGSAAHKPLLSTSYANSMSSHTLPSYGSSAQIAGDKISSGGEVNAKFTL